MNRELPDVQAGFKKGRGRDEKGYAGIYPSKEYGKPKRQEFMHHNYSPDILLYLF